MEQKTLKLQDFAAVQKDGSGVLGKVLYDSLSNISFTKKGGIFSYDNMVSDPHVDPLSYCLEAQRLFELYQNCVGRRQIE